MQRFSSEIYDLLTGTIIFGFGLLFLSFQSKSTQDLIAAVEEQILEQGDLYQQYSNVDINLITDDELYAIIMGIREFPIVIDGKLIDVGENDYDLYFSYVKEGYYIKSYGFDRWHNISQILFTFAGS